MIAAVISIVLGIAAYDCFDKGNVLAGWLCVIVIACVLFFKVVTAEDARAYANCTNYWASRGRRRK